MKDGEDKLSSRNGHYLHVLMDQQKVLMLAKWFTWLWRIITGECCRQGSHVLVSKTGYAKKLTPYCGPEAPKFEKSDFEKGKARWLVVFNNTGSDEQSELQLESPTIGYRSKILF